MTRTTKATSKTTTGTKAKATKGKSLLELARTSDLALDKVEGSDVMAIAVWYGSTGKGGSPVSFNVASRKLRGDDSAGSRLANIWNALKITRKAFPGVTEAQEVEILGLMYSAHNSTKANRASVAKHGFILDYVSKDGTKRGPVAKANAVIAAMPETVKAKATPKPVTVDHSDKDGDSTETADDNGDPLASNRETKQVATIADHIGIVSQWLSNPATSQAELSLHGAILDSLALVMMERDILAS